MAVTWERALACFGVLAGAFVPVGPASERQSPASIRVELPRVVPSTEWPATKRTRSVKAGDNLQAALDAARRGDELVIQAGATFEGNYVLRPKAGSAADGWLVIRTSALGDLPPSGRRVDPETDAANMPKIVTPNTDAALKVLPGVSGVRFVGIEVTATAAATVQPSINYGLFWLGTGDATQATLVQVPTDLVLDRVYIHGQPTTNTTRCLTVNSASTAVVDSYLSDCHAKGFDSQAIIGWNGPGPFLIQNNRLEGAGENVLFGGADPRIPDLNASDVTIRDNYFSKPVSWKGRWTVKNLLELKQAVRVLVEGNVFDGSWVDGQTGFAIMFKSVNQAGRATWAQTADVTFRYNVVRNAAAGINIAARPEARPAVPATRFLIEENIFEQIGRYAGTSVGRMVLLIGDLVDVELRQNTFVHNAVGGAFILMDGGGARNLVVRNNVATWGGPHGAVLGRGAQGTQALSVFASPYTFTGNVVIGMPPNVQRLYPGGNAYPAQLAGAGFVNDAGGDYTLGRGSRYKGAAGGRDPGANIAEVRRRTAAATAGR